MGDFRNQIFVVKLVPTAYKTGVTLATDAMRLLETKLQGLPELGKWFVDILPVSASHPRGNFPGCPLVEFVVSAVDVGLSEIAGVSVFVARNRCPLDVPPVWDRITGRHDFKNCVEVAVSLAPSAI